MYILKQWDKITKTDCFNLIIQATNLQYFRAQIPRKFREGE